jgi:hypothetical protein
MALTLAFACPACGAPVEGSLDAATTAMACPGCSRSTPLPEAAALVASGNPAVCAVCGGADVYRQKDFSRPLGLSLAAAGLLTGPFTYWISTVAAIAFDAVLYLVVPTVAVCYACESQVRGFDPSKAPAPFDIAVHDAYKFGKRFPPRRENAVAGPLRRRLDFDARRRSIQEAR